MEPPRFSFVQLSQVDEGLPPDSLTGEYALSWANGGVFMVVNVGLVLMFALKVLMRNMSMLQWRMIVLMCVICNQVLHIFSSTPGMMNNMDVLMSVNDRFVPVRLKSFVSHLKSSP